MTSLATASAWPKLQAQAKTCFIVLYADETSLRIAATDGSLNGALDVIADDKNHPIVEIIERNGSIFAPAERKCARAYLDRWWNDPDRSYADDLDSLPEFVREHMDKEIEQLKADGRLERAA